MRKLNRISKAMVRQHDQSDCGVTCIKSISKYYGKDISIEQLRSWSGASLEGTTILGVVQALKSCGFQAGGYQATFESLKDCNDICILHVLIDKKHSHYLIYWGYDALSQKYIIGDPALGQIELYSENELDIIWESKYLILLEDTWKIEPNFQAENENLKRIIWLKEFVKPDLNLLVMALTIGVVVAILGLSTAIFSQKLIDDILPSKDKFRLFSGLALLLILLISRNALNYIRQLFLIRQAKDFNIRIVGYFTKKLLMLPKVFFDNKRTGDLISRINDTEKIQSTISQIITNVLVDILIVITTLIATFIYDWKVGFFVLIWLPTYIWLASRYTKSIIDSQQQAMVANASSESIFVDTMQGAETIKVFNREELFSNIINLIFADYQQKTFNIGKISVSFVASSEVLGAIFICILLGATSLLAINDQMTTGAIFAIIQLASIFMTSTSRIVMTNIQLQGAKIAFDRMQEFSTMSPEYSATIDNENIIVDDFKELKINLMSFRFPGRKLLFHDINLYLKKGELVVLQGETGKGKSTLLHIVQKFYTKDSGDIHINGIDLNLISTKSWRNCIGVMPQEIFIFSGTIADNILFGASPNNEGHFNAFLEEFGFSAYFSQFPQNAFTLIGKEGINLSGGQKLILGLARALWKKPQILLLDEPTAALDKNTETFVLAILAKAKKEMGILLLTHRDVSVSYADRIYNLSSAG